MKKTNKRGASGLIQIRVDIGVDAEGKRIRKAVYGKTQAEAEQKASELRIQHGRGVDISRQRDSLQTWADMWLKQKQVRVSSAWLESCKTYVGYLCESLGHREIISIRNSDLQSVIDALAVRNPNTGKPSSKKLLVDIRSTSRQIFRMAVKNHILVDNPADELDIPKTPRPTERRALTDKEIKWIETTEHRAQIGAMVMLYCGLRRGELIPLRWSDIDLKARTLTVNKSVSRDGNTYVQKQGGKSESATRVIPIPSKLALYLAQARKKSLYVCPDAHGRMHTKASWRRMWDSYMAELNRQHGNFTPFVNRPRSKYDPKGTPQVIEPITPHMLRHTYATMLYRSETDLLTASKLLGHSDPKLTLAVYTHFDEEYAQKSIAKFDEFVSAL